MDNEMSLEGRVAIVVGGSGELGAAISTKLASFGASVVVVYLTRSERAGDVVERISKMNRGSISIKADITVASDVGRMVSLTLKEFGAIDILVNSAGIAPVALPIIELSEEIWDQVINVNLKGPFLCCKAVASKMVERKWGRIINISSIFGKYSPALRGAYGASKHGLIGLTQTLAKELAQYNITVNAICPGPVDTTMVRDIWTKASKIMKITFEEYYQRQVCGIPVKRLAMPEEVANLVAFIASPMAAYVNGAIIDIAGGAT